MTTNDQSARAGDGNLPPLPTPAEFFVFAGLDWHRATSSYFAQMNGQTNTLALFTADQMHAYARAALAAAPAAAPAGFALVPLDVLRRCRDAAMHWSARGRAPECGEFGGIAQDLDAVIAAAPALSVECPRCGKVFAAAPAGYKLLEDGRTMIPEGWACLKVERVPGHPATVAYGPAEHMELLRKELDGLHSDLRIVQYRQSLPVVEPGALGAAVPAPATAPEAGNV